MGVMLTNRRGGGGRSRGDAESASAGGEEGRAEAGQGQFEEVAAGEVLVWGYEAIIQLRSWR